MAKLKPARPPQRGAKAAQIARGLPCLFLVIGGTLFLGILFYLILRG